MNSGKLGNVLSKRGIKVIKTVSHQGFKKGFTPLDSSKSRANSIRKVVQLSNGASLNSRCYLTGFTIIEMMVAILVVGVLVIGTAGYRYYSALDARRAENDATATRIALLLNEGWRGAMDGNGVVTSFNPTKDPTKLDGIITDFKVATATGSVPSTPSGFTLLGNYQVTTDNAVYLVTMSYKALSQLSPSEYQNYPGTSGTPGSTGWTGVVRMPLNIIVAWPITKQATTYNPNDPSQAWSVTLTTYVEQVLW